MTTRSSALVRHRTNGSGWEQILPIEANVVVIVKSIFIVNMGPEPAQIILQASDPTIAVTARILNETLANTEFREWNGWLVLFAGHALESYCPKAEVHIWVSGAVLPPS